jgi:ubiquinone/menaquinone biosynthesis C-methylase UbiE
MNYPQKPVDSTAYSADYFLTECEGHDEFLHTGGKSLPRRLSAALELAGDLAGKRTLDLGCGRGEVVRYCLEHGSKAIGLDYSNDALLLAQGIIPPGSTVFIRADVQRLPFQNASFDLVFALDLVEHLYLPELDQLLAEVWRVLTPGGRLVVHTMPNIWYYRFGYPLFRLVQRIRGRNLPRDPRSRWRYVKELHVNEQSVISLSHALHRAGFGAQIKLRNIQDFSQESSGGMRFIMKFLATTPLLASIFCNDLFGIAQKKTQV